MPAKNGCIKKTTINKLMNGDVVRVYGTYDAVGFILNDNRVKIRIDRDCNGRKRYGASVLWAQCDEDGNVTVENEQWEIDSPHLYRICEAYLIAFLNENYMRSHPIVSRCEEPQKPNTPTPQPEIDVDDNIITVTSFTVKMTDGGMSIEFTTDNGKTIIARYGK